MKGGQEQGGITPRLGMTGRGNLIWHGVGVKCFKAILEHRTMHMERGMGGKDWMSLFGH